jgi:hemoglobin
MSETKSLYDRLGGVYSIATLVDDFIDRIMEDDRLNANPLVNDAHHKVARAGFKYLVTEMMCWAAGGPQQYSGKSMSDSHSHLQITPSEWVAFMGDLDDSLAKFQVPTPEQAEVVAIVESTRKDIVIEA